MSFFRFQEIRVTLGRSWLTSEGQRTAPALRGFGLVHTYGVSLEMRVAQFASDERVPPQLPMGAVRY